MQQSQMQQIHQLSDQDGWTVMSQNAKKLLQVTLTFATKMSNTASPCQKCLCPAPSGTRNSRTSELKRKGHGFYNRWLLISLCAHME